MAKIRLTKNELKSQKDNLKRFTRYLPTLELKKKQLLQEIRKLQYEIDGFQAEYHRVEREVYKWADVFTDEVDLRDYIEIKEVGIGHGNIGKPVKIGLGPFGSAGKCEPVSEQKGVEPLFGFSGCRHGILPGTGQIAHGLVLGVGDINGGQLPGAVQAGQHGGIPAVVFNPIPAFFRDRIRRFFLLCAQFLCGC